MKTILNVKFLIIFTFCLAGIVLVIFAVFFLAEETKIFSSDFHGENSAVQNLSCVFSAEEKIVRGGSLAGLIEDGQIIKVLFGYYDCNEVKREDAIAYDYSGTSEPIIKIIKGIPGDKFDFQETDAGWHILINREILKNSKNQPYVLDERGHRMLSLYQEDYNGIIPEKIYLILGNLTASTMDSTRFGLVHQDDFLAKVSLLR